MSTEPTTRMTSAQAANSTRAAVLALGRRMERFEGQARGTLTAEDLRRLRAEVLEPLRLANRLLVPEGQPMTEVSWRAAWTLVGQASTAWDRLAREWRSPTRVVTVPFTQALDGAQSVVDTARELAPRVAIAAAGGMVIAALAGLWLLSKVAGSQNV